MKRLALHLALGVGLALTAFQPALAAADAPDQYAARWPLQLPAGAGLVRLPLPAEVLTQLQTADLRDLRVFNGAGQPVPLALDRSSPETRVPAPPPIALPALPILADAQPGTATAGNNLSLRIEDGPGGRVVRLDTPPAGAGAPAATLVGALIDTREQKAALQAIELDADWPAARPFAFRLHTSSDLRHWQPLGDVTAYRGADGTMTAPARVELHGDVLQGRYLRVTWDRAAAPDAVQLRGVRLLPVPPVATPPRIAVPLALPAGAAGDPHAIEWRLPFATPVAALDIRLEGSHALVPVRLLARQQREQPWTPLARHVVFHLTQDGQEQRSPPLELGPHGAWRDWRLEADAATPGFTTPPQLTAWLAPAQLVFVASGGPPFTLAAGRADAAGTYLPLPSLIPGYEPGAQGRLPAAILAGAAPAVATPTAAPVATIAPGGQRDLRQWTLWAVLVAGVLALGGMAWALMRQLGKPPGDRED